MGEQPDRQVCQVCSTAAHHSMPSFFQKVVCNPYAAASVNITAMTIKGLAIASSQASMDSGFVLGQGADIPANTACTW